MSSNSEVFKKLKTELPHLREKFGVKKIGVFGSYSRGKPGNKSDVDLIVEFEKPIGLGFIALSDHLENLLGIKVDVLTPAGVKSIRIPEVSKRIKGNIVYV
jgi:predicted nucleotidyltransferase